MGSGPGRDGHDRHEQAHGDHPRILLLRLDKGRGGFAEVLGVTSRTLRRYGTTSLRHTSVTSLRCYVTSLPHHNVVTSHLCYVTSLLRYIFVTSQRCYVTLLSRRSDVVDVEVFLLTPRLAPRQIKEQIRRTIPTRYIRLTLNLFT